MKARNEESKMYYFSFLPEDSFTFPLPSRVLARLYDTFPRGLLSTAAKFLFAVGQGDKFSSDL